MKQLDQSTIKQMGIPSLVLMERAALAVFDCLKQHFPLKKTLIVCGSGNNGADGVAVARLLHLAGYPVDLYLAGNHTSFTEEMNIQWQAAKNYQVSIVNNCRFSEYTTIVDALFGVGLSRELSGKIPGSGRENQCFRYSGSCGGYSIRHPCRHGTGYGHRHPSNRNGHLCIP